MDLNRRAVLATSTGLALGLSATSAAARKERGVHSSEVLALEPGTERDQTTAIQEALDAAHETGSPVVLPPGRFVTRGLELHSGSRLISHGKATLVAVGAEAMIRARGAADLAIEGFRLEGSGKTQDIIALEDCRRLRLARIEITGAAEGGVRLDGCSGTILDCSISNIGNVGIFALDSGGLEITRNAISSCGNNGIQVWRSAAGEEGTLVTCNRITGITARDGGDGPNGNGVNVFRAGNVTVANNKISDCAFSAVRGNAASNIQITGNTCVRLGEVALYAEFGFEGAIIANNLVDTAATGIAVTNFNEGGRLAVVQGNLVRNLFRREHEPVDKRGEGITVEADAAVSGNTIEQAATAGIAIGWGPYMRDVSVMGNVIRQSRVGIMISSDGQAGACLVATNMISGSVDGAIRAMDRGKAHGPDLATAATQTERITISGNLAV